MRDKIKQLYLEMLNNPNFENFVINNENKTIDEIITEYDLKGVKCTEN